VTGIALPHAYTGKVRDLYDVDHDRMLIVASDRISVFDVVLDDLVPDKGRALTALSTFFLSEDLRLLLAAPDPSGRRGDRESRESLARVLVATLAVGIASFTYKLGLRAGAAPIALVAAQGAVAVTLAMPSPSVIAKNGWLKTRMNAFMCEWMSQNTRTMPG